MLILFWMFLTPHAFAAGSEVCDGVDNDGDGLIDDDDPDVIDQSTWYRDADGDLYGDPEVAVDACMRPTGYFANSRDCDDTDPEINPGVGERCDGEDTNCNGLIDDEAINALSWYFDEDGDGFGADFNEVRACSEVIGRIGVGGDCNDRDPTINPHALDYLGDGINNDCQRGTDHMMYDLHRAYARLGGISDGGSAGFSVSGAGDINGDGYDDIIVGAPREGALSSDSGGAYVLLGPLSGGYDGTLRETWRWIGGANADARAGSAVEGAGDVDGDGYADVLIGVPRDATYANNAGAAYLFTGDTLAATSHKRLSTDDADAQILGKWEMSYAGDYLTGAVDANGDGYDDFIVGASGSTGYAYLVHGPVTGTLDDGDVDAVFDDDATTYTFAIKSMAAGDLTGDGTPDFLFGGSMTPPYGDTSWGACLVEGPIIGDYDLASCDGNIVNADGESLAIGDYDGDGNNDIALTTSAPSGGGVHIFTSEIVGETDATDSEGLLEAWDSGSNIGVVANAGDLNGDDMDDLVIGDNEDREYGAQNHERGAVFIALGPATGTSTLGQNGGVALGSANYTYRLGTSVDGAGDVDGDGNLDIIFGAYGEFTDTGAAYVVSGAALFPDGL